MSKKMLHGLIEMIPEDDINVQFKAIILSSSGFPRLVKSDITANV